MDLLQMDEAGALAVMLQVSQEHPSHSGIQQSWACFLK